MQVVVQLMAKQTGTVRQIPRAGKLQTGKTYHMDSVPLFLDADDEINTLEHLCASNSCHVLGATGGGGVAAWGVGFLCVLHRGASPHAGP